MEENSPIAPYMPFVSRIILSAITKACTFSSLCSVIAISASRDLDGEDQMSAGQTIGDVLHRCESVDQGDAARKGVGWKDADSWLSVSVKRRRRGARVARVNEEAWFVQVRFWRGRRRLREAGRCRGRCGGCRTGVVGNRAGCCYKRWSGVATMARQRVEVFSAQSGRTERQGASDRSIGFAAEETRSRDRCGRAPVPKPVCIVGRCDGVRERRGKESCSLGGQALVLRGKRGNRRSSERLNGGIDG